MGGRSCPPAKVLLGRQLAHGVGLYQLTYSLYAAFGQLSYKQIYLSL